MEFPRSILTVLFFGWLVFSSESFADKIKIGVSAPLSGSGAIYGEDISDFIRFANHDLSQDRYTLVFEDDRCNAKDALNASRKLIEADKVPYVIGFACSSTVLVTAPLYEKSKIPVIVVFASSPRVADLGEYIFRTYPSDNNAGQILRAAVDKQDYSKIAVISEQTDYAQDLKNVFVKSSISKAEIIPEDYAPDTTDFRSILLRLRSKNPQALFVNTQVEATFAIVLKQLREMKWKPQIYGAYWPGSESLRKISGTDIEGTKFVDTPALSDLLNAEGQQVLERYKKSGGKIRSTEAVFASCYEAFHALHNAIMAHRDVQKYLSATKFEGLFGPWHFDQQGEIVGLNLIMKEIIAGQPVNF